MEYINQYNQFYSKYYLKVELLIKNFLIKYQNKKKASNFSINLVSQYLNKYQGNIFPNKEIENLNQLFNLRNSIYGLDASEEILKNELKEAFTEINLDKFQNYNYNKFIKELAIYEMINEISRLISNNFTLFEIVKFEKTTRIKIKSLPKSPKIIETAVQPSYLWLILSFAIITFSLFGNMPSFEKAYSLYSKQKKALQFLTLCYA